MRRAFYNKCALKINRAPENRSAARFLGKRSGRRSGQGGKRSAPPAMAPWRDEAQRGETAASMARKFARQRTAGFPLPHDFFFRQHERKSVNNANNFLRGRKPRLSVSAPHLPHTCGSCRKGEGGARFTMVCPQKRTAEENPNQNAHLPMRVLVGVFLKSRRSAGVSSPRNA